VQFFEGRWPVFEAMFEISVTITLDLFDGLLLTSDTLFRAGSGLISTEDIKRYDIAVHHRLNGFVWFTHI
jgi:hypothetical protein